MIGSGYDEDFTVHSASDHGSGNGLLQIWRVQVAVGLADDMAVASVVHRHARACPSTR